MKKWLVIVLVIVLGCPIYTLGKDGTIRLHEITDEQIEKFIEETGHIPIGVRLFTAAMAMGFMSTAYLKSSSGYNNSFNELVGVYFLWLSIKKDSKRNSLPIEYRDGEYHFRVASGFRIGSVMLGAMVIYAAVENEPGDEYLDDGKTFYNIGRGFFALAGLCAIVDGIKGKDISDIFKKENNKSTKINGVFTPGYAGVSLSKRF